MPIYEYRCGACAHTLDALQKLSDPPLTDCPECGAVALKKLVSAPVFRLKGGGWYETDFKSDKDKRRNLADGGSGDPSAKSGAAKDGAADGASAAKADKPADKSSDKGAGKSSDKVADKAAKPAAGNSTAGASSSKGAGTAAA